MLALAVIGDIHGHWSDDDQRALDAAELDAVLIVGDLAGLRWSHTLQVARGLAKLRTRALMIAGNHDGPNPAQLLAEVAGRPWLGDPFASRQSLRYDVLIEALGAVELGGYSAHELGPADDRLTVVVARPQSMGGPTLSFPGFLTQRFEVDSLEASARRLRSVIDSVRTERVVFLAHNGPAGLGTSRSDIWGCDFKAAEGDWGDTDLESAVTYARDSGKRVLAVLAGHMHHRVRGGGERTWKVERDGVTYVNAARVPRVDSLGRHHVRVEIDGDRVHVADSRVLA